MTLELIKAGAAKLASQEPEEEIKPMEGDGAGSDSDDSDDEGSNARLKSIQQRGKLSLQELDSDSSSDHA